ncbi:protein kinase domain-containing protein [Conexibacter woesei]|uniref:protein kinase domain-containing protein n=1 Tax=Conexibacter woesei TaxID=191495 RepID=UPI0003FAB1BD|nr:protein kinase [Conexibacter woesei]
MSGGTIAGRYELGERLGLGGMSTVVVAFDTRLERYVAVKLLAEHLADDQQFVARFRREAMAAARMVHPNIVQVYDFGLDDQTGRHYIVMERIVGPSGAQILKDRGRLPVDEAVDWIAQACRGLEYAHRNGLVHRDVKPGNLLLSEADGTIKLADFGIAKIASDESSITQVGSVLGTAAYLAPEQAAGEEAGPAADLYGLGVVAYQLLSGRLPYEAQSLTELALKQQREVPRSLHQLDPAIPGALSVAVERALALNPKQRYGGSADTMRTAVLDGARGIGPDEDATQVVGGWDDDATTVFAGEPGTAPLVVPREPRAPRRAAPPVAAPAAGRESPRARAERSAAAQQAAAQQRQGRRKRGAFRRFVTFVLLIAVLAAVGAAAYVATSQKDNSVHLRQVVHDDADQVISDLKQLIQDNTR